ncbi:MAG: trehalose-phosphatase [Candidatus Lambdaproteobacteria bacterium]|nr:trehalose-phosphatase [Candidatus Lambdaproteobacteria bacterium]
MDLVDPAFNLAGFFERVAAAERRVLLLDYDGTLAPFTLDPAQAVPYPGVCARLDALMEAGHTRIALVSGRAVASVLPLLDLRRPPEVWGSHGWERLLPDGRYRMQPLPPPELEALDAAGRALEAGIPVRLERKPAGLAAHWRGAPAAAIEGIRVRIVAAWEPLAREAGLELHPFDGGLELRPQGLSKGDAVNTVLAEAGIGAVAAYLGDDLTDEDAFRAIRDVGLGVLVRQELRPTAASVWLRPPGEMLEFLDHWGKRWPAP